MTKLYFAPINILGNYAYRHFLLLHKADFVFSELLLPEDIKLGRKLKIFKGDLDRTIFQIGASSVKEISLAVEKLGKVKEINLNMGCPQSSMQQKGICSGILFDLELMGKLCSKLSSYDFIPSVKLRLGASPSKIEIEKYLQICLNNGVKKVYIHFRTLRHNYSSPVLEIENLKSKFPSMELIYNGDIDCYSKCKGYDGYMIGRAALSNPLIFEQIKNEVECKVKHYNFTLNDSSLVTADGRTSLSVEKEKVILEFVSLALKEGLDVHLLNKNLKYLFKGVSDKTLLKELTS